MATFIFSEEVEKLARNSKPRLAGGEIHTVKVKSAEFGEYPYFGKGNRKGLRVTWFNETGEFSYDLFAPGEKQNDREKNSFGGERPSENEDLAIFVLQIFNTYNPEAKKKLLGKDFTNKFDAIAKLIKAVLDEAAKKGVEADLKLLARRKDETIFPQMPFYSAVNKEGELYNASTFIGEVGSIAFTSKELTKIKEVKEAVPTKATGVTPFAVKPQAAGKKFNIQLDEEDEDEDEEL